MTTPLLVPLMSTDHRRAWPKHPDAWPVRYQPVHIALTRRSPTDAHTAAYAVPTWPRRLSRAAVGHPALPDGVPMALAIFDVDCAASHTAPDPHAADAWWNDEREKLRALRTHHPDLFIYRTRGGYRVLGTLVPPIILRTAADAALWSTCYLAWVGYLARMFAIQGDPACKDWTRLYRLPHATRDPGGHPEELAVIGEPWAIGIWRCNPTAEDMAMASRLGRRTGARPRGRPSYRQSPAVGTGEGLLYHAFAARGWLGPEIESGTLAAAYPWESSHTKGERFDTSTVLFLPRPGDLTGWFHCSHAHCQDRTLRDVLALFSHAELDRAREQAGLPVHRGGRQTTGATRGLRTVPAARVPLWRTVSASEVKTWH